MKQSVVGNGRATKDQIQWMIKVLLNLPKAPPPDAADALAIALCYFHTTFKERLQKEKNLVRLS